MSQIHSVLKQIREFGQLMHRKSRYNVELNEVISETHSDITELPMMQKHVLYYIIQSSTCKEVYQRDIERYFYIRRSTASTILKALEKRGLIERHPSQTDGRLKKITVSEDVQEAFLKVYREIEVKMSELEDKITKNISDDDITHFLATLNKMKQNIEDLEEE